MHLNFLVSNVLLADTNESDGQPFVELNEEALFQTRKAAEASLAKQRKGMEGGVQLNPREGAEDLEISLAPKSSGTITVGPPWDGESQVSKQGRGLVARANGYMYVCEYDSCMEGWRTEVLPSEQTSLLIEMYKLHISQCHEKKKNSDEEEKFDKDQENYKEAVRLRTVEAHKDNRLDILSPARFFPMPLQYQSIAKLQPSKQTPVWDRLDLAHLGIHLADTSIVAKMHNMANGGFQLKECAAMNLSVNQSDKDLMFRLMHSGVMRQTRNVKSIKTMAEAIGALGNCEVIWRHIHPMDYGTTAVVRFLMDRINHAVPEKKLANVDTVCAFFQAAMKANADRVLGPQHPMTYQEVVTLYDSMDWGTSVKSIVTTPVKQDWRKPGGTKRPNVESGFNKRKDIKTEILLCHGFNSAGGCHRSNGDWCGSYGKKFMHQCDKVKDDGSVCGAKDHGSTNHK